MIRPALPSDAPQIARIYNHYVERTVVTFEEQPVSNVEMSQRIADVTASLPWLVLETDGAIVGYAYARSWHTRSAYRFSVESTIYLAPEFTGRGIGSELYRAIIVDLRARGLHCIVG
ncbi:MAG TPA: GNAT family N-acetyltransferase, partial [Rhodothermia bacterium]